MNKTKTSAIVAIIAATLLMAHSGLADAATQSPYIKDINTKSYKGNHITTFKACVGSQTMSGAGVVVTSGIASVPLKIKAIPAGKCNTFSVNIPAIDTGTIKPKLVPFSAVDNMKTTLQAEIKELKEEIEQLQKNKPTRSGSNENGKLQSKAIKEHSSKINELRMELKNAQRTLNGLYNWN